MLFALEEWFCMLIATFPSLIHCSFLSKMPQLLSHSFLIKWWRVKNTVNVVEQHLDLQELSRDLVFLVWRSTPSWLPYVKALLTSILSSWLYIFFCRYCSNASRVVNCNALFYKFSCYGHWMLWIYKSFLAEILCDTVPTTPYYCNQ